MKRLSLLADLHHTPDHLFSLPSPQTRPIRIHAFLQLTLDGTRSCRFRPVGSARARMYHYRLSCALRFTLTFTSSFSFRRKDGPRIIIRRPTATHRTTGGQCACPPQTARSCCDLKLIPLRVCRRQPKVLVTSRRSHRLSSSPSCLPFLPSSPGSVRLVALIRRRPSYFLLRTSRFPAFQITHAGRRWSGCRSVIRL